MEYELYHKITFSNLSAENESERIKKYEIRYDVIGHSYGTFLASSFYRDKANQTNRLVLLDPVCLCLSQPVTVKAVSGTPDNTYDTVLQVRFFFFSFCFYGCLCFACL